MPSGRSSSGSGIASTLKRNARATPTATLGARQEEGASSAPATAPPAKARWNSRYSAALLWAPVPSSPPPGLTVGNEMSCSTIATRLTTRPPDAQLSAGTPSARARIARIGSAASAHSGAAPSRTSARPCGGTSVASSATT